MSITYEEILNLFKETDQKFKETDQQFKEIGRQFKETDRKLQELAISHKETDRTLQELAISHKETERLMKESSREVNEKLKELEQLFVSQWGKLIESLVEGDLIKILRNYGILVMNTSMRLKGQTADGGNYEFDILAHNGDEVVVVEVKTTLRPKDVSRFIAKLNCMKPWIPRYTNNRIYGAVAWLTADAGAEQMAMKRGLLSIRATGNSAFIQNPIGSILHQW